MFLDVFFHRMRLIKIDKNWQQWEVSKDLAQYALDKNPWISDTVWPRMTNASARSIAVPNGQSSKWPAVRWSAHWHRSDWMTNSFAVIWCGLHGCFWTMTTIGLLGMAIEMAGQHKIARIPLDPPKWSMVHGTMPWNGHDIDFLRYQQLTKPDSAQLSSPFQDCLLSGTLLSQKSSPWFGVTLLLPCTTHGP